MDFTFISFLLEKREIQTKDRRLPKYLSQSNLEMRNFWHNYHTRNLRHTRFVHSLTRCIWNLRNIQHVKHEKHSPNGKIDSHTWVSHTMTWVLWCTKYVSKTGDRFLKGLSNSHFPKFGKMDVRLKNRSLPLRWDSGILKTKYTSFINDCEEHIASFSANNLLSLVIGKGWLSFYSTYQKSTKW